LNFSSRLNAGLAIARTRLLEARNAQGHWTGQLSSSALSTATAVCALAVAQRQGGAADARRQDLVASGLAWLADHVNPDGGWGDTTLSLSNISTTTLGWAAFGVVPGAAERYPRVVQGVENWLRQRAGLLAPDALAHAIIQRYGNDRTFSVPILTACALAGRLGTPAEAWSHVIPLPFELAVFPPAWFAALRLPVVSYALPALISMGLARHQHRPARNPAVRFIRNSARARALAVLDKIQPPNGGFLEATPLTSFVVMSLAGSGYARLPVVRRGMEFLIASARPDGSWPIDTNLATWLTTLAVNALAQAPGAAISERESAPIREWLLKQQFRERHPYTNAPPGGWAWTDLPGGVPDADDTAGALLALRALEGNDPQSREAAVAGITWLLNLQNRDGGIPTFCRGWGRLPFDQSSADLTAHAMRAWQQWLPVLPSRLQSRVHSALARAAAFLASRQPTAGESAGAWSPLWFGNQHGQDELNWTYGTSRVLLACSLPQASIPQLTRGLAAAQWLVKTQRADGSWGGGTGAGPASVEETALAVEALADCLAARRIAKNANPWPEGEAALTRGTSWLLDRVEDGSWTQPSPIGFYFAKLWYYERLYPVIFTVAALGRSAKFLTQPEGNCTERHK